MLPTILFNELCTDFNALDIFPISSPRPIYFVSTWNVRFPFAICSSDFSTLSIGVEILLPTIIAATTAITSIITDIIDKFLIIDL